MKKIGLFAAIAALLCGFLIYTWMDSVEKRVTATEAPAPVVETVPVVTAVESIPPYTAIKTDQLTLTDFPADYVPETAVLSLDEVKGLYSNRTIYAGEILYTNAVTAKEKMEAPLSYRIPEGMRAMTIGVNSATGVAGYVTEGDVLDIYAYYKTEIHSTKEDPVTGGTGDGDSALVETYIQTNDRVLTSSGEHYFPDTAVVSINLLESVEVLAVDTPFYTEEGIYTSLTLALTPEQCVKLNLMEWREGVTLTLALRPRDDRSEGSGLICTLSEVIG